MCEINNAIYILNNIEYIQIFTENWCFIINSLKINNVSVGVSSCSDKHNKVH